MDKYLMIFRNTPTSEETYQNMSPEEMQASLDQWGAWIGSIAAQGTFISSDALSPEGKVVAGSKKVVSDGPYAEGKELVSGYMLLEAGSEELALEAAKGCPIYDIEGSVEVRKLMVY
jgi:hypothetical protein